MVSLSYEEVLNCCASKTFAQRLASHSPFQDEAEVFRISKDIWWTELSIFDWLEAFQAHPSIGERATGEGLGSAFSVVEQSMAAQTADESLKQELAHWNAKYKQRFGHVFLIFAQGKSSREILSELCKRYFNTADIELRHAAIEQQKITEKRLTDTFARQQVPLDSNSVVDRRAANLASQLGSSSKAGPSVAKQKKTSPITTHVLDTCNGRPASGVSIDLEYCSSSSPQTWIPIGRGKTNSDGRISDLLPSDASPQPGWYCLTFHVGEYVEQCRIENPTFFRDASFYPFVKIHFNIRQDQVNQHFHVPLTWNPFGYSTYRGS